MGLIFQEESEITPIYQLFYRRIRHDKLTGLNKITGTGYRISGAIMHYENRWNFDGPEPDRSELGYPGLSNPELFLPWFEVSEKNERAETEPGSLVMICSGWTERWSGNPWYAARVVYCTTSQLVICAKGNIVKKYYSQQPYLELLQY